MTQEGKGKKYLPRTGVKKKKQKNLYFLTSSRPYGKIFLLPFNSILNMRVGFQASKSLNWNFFRNCGEGV